MNRVLTEDREHIEFDALELERYRREMSAYCYRMLGSTFEADDAVQNTLMRAWRSADRFEGRSSVRSWLYRIATNVCLDILKGRSRRAMPMDLGPSSPGDGSGELAAEDVLWLQPIPDAAIAPAGRSADDVVVARESIRLAFIAALQFLPARQRSILILRDVLGWHATEVAELLDMSHIAVHSALRRARDTLASRDQGLTDAPTPLGSEERSLVERYVAAFERFDVDTLVSLLRDDAVLSMPPRALWLQGPDALRAWWSGDGSGCAGMRFLPAPANGSLAYAMYKPSPGGGYHAFGIQVIEASGGGITALHAFIEADLVARFGLPTRL